MGNPSSGAEINRPGYGARGEGTLHAFARAPGPQVPEATRHGTTDPHVFHRLAGGGAPLRATPQNPGDLPGDVYLGPVSSCRAPSDADRVRAQLTAEEASFREGTVMRGARAFTEFHIERSETGK